MAWTNINKPTAPVWTNTNPAGRTEYDQGDITYDEATMFYDGYDPNQWTDVTRPNASGYFDTTWAQMGMPWSEADLPWGEITNEWTKVNKPT